MPAEIALIYQRTIRYCIAQLTLQIPFIHAIWLIKNALTGSQVYSRGTKVEKMLTLAPERYTAGFCMVAKVILWCI